VLQTLSHRNIVQYFGIYKESEIYIVTEYLSLGSLNNLLQMNKDIIEINELISMIMDATA